MQGVFITPRGYRNEKPFFEEAQKDRPSITALHPSNPDLRLIPPPAKEFQLIKKIPGGRSSLSRVPNRELSVGTKMLFRLL